MPPVSPSAASSCFLQLDGVNSSPLRSVSGGGISADVVSYSSGAGGPQQKVLGNIHFGDFLVSFIPLAGDVCLNWAVASLTGAPAKKSGSLIAADAAGTARMQADFTGAFLSQVRFPACDGSSKDPGYLALAITPETIRWVKATGKVATRSKVGKAWTSSNFKLEIPGIDCTKVSKIESFTVKTVVTEVSGGVGRIPQKQPGSLEFPNLIVSVAESGAQTWIDWHDDFAIQGNSGNGKEKSGTLVLLGPDLKEELLRVNLSGLGIFSLERDSIEANSNAIRRVTAGLYCEGITIQV